MMLEETRNALIAQQKMMQTSLDEAIREVSERVWAEGYGVGVDHAYGEINDAPNPYTRGNE